MANTTQERNDLGDECHLSLNQMSRIHSAITTNLLTLLGDNNVQTIPLSNLARIFYLLHNGTNRHAYCPSRLIKECSL